MRIVLTQAEIEEAIEKLILDQVAVPEDMRIDIDLKATRGEEGYQAFIDIVAHDAPTDGSDRSVDSRIDALPGNETLDIAAKVLEAKEAASRPRRRGRPAGARNLPKHPETAEADKRMVTTGDAALVEKVENKAEELISEAVAEPVPEPAAESQEAAVEASTNELVLDTPIVEEAIVEAPVPTTEEVTEEAPVAIQEPTPVPEIFNEPDAVASVAEPVEEEDVDYTPTPETAGFETDQAEAVEEVIPHTPAATVNETDVSDQVAEVAEETAPEAAPTPAPAAPAPTKSLFANLSRPQNQV